MKGNHRKQGTRGAGQAGAWAAKEAAVHRYPHPIRTGAAMGTEKEALERILEQVTRQTEQLDELVRLARGMREGIDNK